MDDSLSVAVSKRCPYNDVKMMCPRSKNYPPSCTQSFGCSSIPVIVGGLSIIAIRNPYHLSCNWNRCHLLRTRSVRRANLRSLIIYNAKFPEKAVPERLANTLLTSS